MAERIKAVGRRSLEAAVVKQFERQENEAPQQEKYDRK